MDLHLLFQLLLNGLIVGALYGVVAMCFVLIYKASQVVNFAQGEFLLIGAWVCWWLLTKYQMPFYASFLGTLAFMMAFGFILQIVVLRPLIGEPVISVIMVTIGLSIFFQALMKWMFGVFAQPFPPIFATRSVNVLGLEVETVYVMSTVVSLAIMAGLRPLLGHLGNGVGGGGRRRRRRSRRLVRPLLLRYQGLPGRHPGRDGFDHRR